MYGKAIWRRAKTLEYMTGKQEQFVEYYCEVGAKTYGDATKSAVKAGYSELTAKAIGAENLTKPAVRAAIEAKKAEIAKRAEITMDQVVRTAQWLIDYGIANNRHQAVQAGNAQLMQIGGFGTDNKQSATMPTINVHLPEPRTIAPGQPRLRLTGTNGDNGNG